MPRGKNSSWVYALKQLNKGKQSWCIPKRGTPDYEMVRKIQKKHEAERKDKPLPAAKPKAASIARTPLKSGISPESSREARRIAKKLELKSKRSVAISKGRKAKSSKRKAKSSSGSSSKRQRTSLPALPDDDDEFDL